MPRRCGRQRHAGHAEPRGPRSQVLRRRDECVPERTAQARHDGVVREGGERGRRQEPGPLLRAAEARGGEDAGSRRPVGGQGGERCLCRLSWGAGRTRR
jgi:hypothetical protein